MALADTMAMMRGQAIIRSYLPVVLLSGLLGVGSFSPVFASDQAGFDTASPDRGDSSSADNVPRVLRLETIEINGNTRTPEKIIIRHLGLESGDEVGVESLDAGRERLIATDYFKEVAFSTRPGAERGTVILVIDVTERSFMSFETGFGYDDLYGWFMTLVGLRLDNTFGLESRFRMGLRFGFRISGLDAEFDTPIPRDGGFGFGAQFHVYNQRQLFYGSGPSEPQPWSGDQWKRFEQDITRVGIEAGLKYGFGGATRFSFGLHVQSNEPDSVFVDRSDDKEFVPGDLPTEISQDIEKRLTTGAFFRVIRDTRDYDAYPRSGSFSRLTLEVNNTFLGGDQIFSKATGDVRKHIPLGKRSVFSSRVGGGIITDGASYYDRFYIGGNYTIRGFEEWSLSPTGGDDGFWLVNAEFRTPLIRSRAPQPRLTGLLFVDAGQGWRRGESFSFRDVQSAVGYGVRLRLPWLGTLGLDAAVPLSEGRTGDPFRVHLLLGFSY